MPATPGPVEWVPGKSLALWWLGLAVIFFVVFEAGVVATDSLVPRLALTWLFLSLALTVPAMALAILTYYWANPMPLHSLGLRPDGILLNYGLRTIEIPPSQVHIAGTRLFILPRHTGIAGAYSLSESQAARLRTVVKGIASAAG